MGSGKLGGGVKSEDDWPTVAELWTGGAVSSRLPPLSTDGSEGRMSSRLSSERNVLCSAGLEEGE